MDKLIPVVIIKELGETDKILTALKNYGINCAEITFRTACAAEAIEYACKNYPDMNVGAGTVINAEQCEKALSVGAKFIVSPGLSPAVAKICKERGVPYYPGCVRAWYFHCEILPCKRLRRFEGNESLGRSFPPNQIYSHGRRKPRQFRRILVLGKNLRGGRLVYGRGSLECK